MRTIRKVLIANRGEIALRIQRAARELGIPSVVVYSDADRAALHVLQAEEAYRLGPSPALESYLRGDLILQIARQCGADAIHPGYGFLSENPDFAAACQTAGIKFIGPTAEAMQVLGSKTRARQAAEASGLARVPGSVTSLSSVAEACRVAQDIRYPVMLKAVAGGGGKGMRAVATPSEMPEAYRSAQSEAERAFASGDLYLEKLVERARHIEIQILADEHGHCIYLGERECSLQRRHQKVVEEAPSPVVGPDLRERMGEAAVRLAMSAGYTNAGTVEFLVDPDGNFYFLEMNTRLQVEHPVTELVTGIDIVQLQIRIAQGEPLALTQRDVIVRGHAIECRIYAEDPENGFFPSPGRITRLLQPSGPGIREDCGIYEGWVVPLDYDPLLSKLIAYAPTRDLAIARLQRALDEYVICGIRTNLSIFRAILKDQDFRAARMDTGSLDRTLAHDKSASLNQPVSQEDEQAATIAAALFHALALEPAGISVPPTSGWKAAARQEGLRS